MSCGNPPVSKLALGVEVELFVSPRENIEGTLFSEVLTRRGWCEYVLSSPDDALRTQQQRDNRLALRHAIAECLRNEGRLGVADPQMELCSSDYHDWVIAPETLREPPRFWGIEIVSRVLSTDQNWQEELDTVFRVITKYCEIMVTPSCGMHVHVSPGPNIPHTEAQLAVICKGLSFYNEATTAVLPGDRKNNAYAMPNFLAEDLFFGVYNAREKFQSIATQSWAPLFQVLDTVCRENINDIMCCAGKKIAWNFMPLWHSGTIEIRRPPGVYPARGAKHWAALVLGLFSAAMSAEWNEAAIQERRDHATVAELRRFLGTGLQKLGKAYQEALVDEWAADAWFAETDDCAEWQGWVASASETNHLW